MKSYVIGLMSGTSLDGIDVALVEIEEVDGVIVAADLIHFLEKGYDEEVKDPLLQLSDPEANITAVSSMNMYMGELFAEAVNELLAETGHSPDDILLISSHGHTVFHQPDPIKINGKDITSTLQIGDIAVIAERTGITTVGDFRTRDMAAGGQGAPLVPFVDQLLFGDVGHGRVMLNIGGISNITVLPGDDHGTVFGYDTGPGNMIIDMFVRMMTDGKQHYDKEGAFARHGSVDVAWLAELLAHDYFKQIPPKTTGREDFGETYAQELWGHAENLGITMPDRIATISELTARTICLEIGRVMERIEVKEVLVSGGGSYNTWIMERLGLLLPDVKVHSTDYLVNASAKEAVAFAILGFECYRGRVNMIPNVTGASKPVVMGKIAW
jgi:anhydro-N-acetylmuramic acid kinase